MRLNLIPVDQRLPAPITSQATSMTARDFSLDSARYELTAEAAKSMLQFLKNNQKSFDHLCEIIANHPTALFETKDGKIDLRQALLPFNFKRLTQNLKTIPGQQKALRRYSLIGVPENFVTLGNQVLDQPQLPISDFITAWKQPFLSMATEVGDSALKAPRLHGSMAQLFTIARILHTASSIAETLDCSLTNQNHIRERAAYIQALRRMEVDLASKNIDAFIDSFERKLLQYQQTFSDEQRPHHRRLFAQDTSVAFRIYERLSLLARPAKQVNAATGEVKKTKHPVADRTLQLIQRSMNNGSFEHQTTIIVVQSKQNLAYIEQQVTELLKGFDAIRGHQTPITNLSKLAVESRPSTLKHLTEETPEVILLSADLQSGLTLPKNLSGRVRYMYVGGKALGLKELPMIHILQQRYDVDLSIIQIIGRQSSNSAARTRLAVQEGRKKFLKSEDS